MDAQFGKTDPKYIKFVE